MTRFTRISTPSTLPFTTNSTNCVLTAAGLVRVPDGNKLPGVPAYTLFGELIWRHAASGFHAGAEVRASGKVYVNDFNCASAAPYTIANLRVEMKGDGLEVLADVR